MLFDGTSVGWAWGIQGGWVKAWGRHLHSGLKEGKGTEVQVALKEVTRRCGTEET